MGTKVTTIASYLSALTRLLKKKVLEATGQSQYSKVTPADQPFILCGTKTDLIEEALQTNPGLISLFKSLRV